MTVGLSIVDAYRSDIISQVEGCDAFMWHFHHGDYRDVQFSKALILSLEAKGIRCFPDSNTCWHFDNKVWEKYLLEAVGAPLVPSYVFYDMQAALSWADNTSFPKVFKLKGGASSVNVKLVRTKGDAKRLICQMFGKGIRLYRWDEQLKEAWRKYRIGKASMRELLRPIKKAFYKYPSSFEHYHGREIGYTYFQDFIPDNNFDIRVCVVGSRAFALKRFTRDGDFRASGSGNIVYDRQQIDERCVKVAFDVNKRLKAQSIAFDFVFDGNNQPKIVETSYGYAVKAYDSCEGYWTDDLAWHEGTHFDFCGWMVYDLTQI